jgi:hypothetical protein
MLRPTGRLKAGKALCLCPVSGESNYFSTSGNVGKVTVY